MQIEDVTNLPIPSLLLDCLGHVVVIFRVIVEELEALVGAAAAGAGRGEAVIVVGTAVERLVRRRNSWQHLVTCGQDWVTTWQLGLD